MAIDTSVQRSRRALLAGGIGGLVALVASAFGRPVPASAADGDIVHVGGEYAASSVTKLSNMSNASTVVGVQTGGGIGVHSESASAIGVYGKSVSGVGVDGWSTAGPGVHGYSHTDHGVEGESGSTWGVYGYSLSGTGVVGRNDSDVLPAMIGWSRRDNTGLLGYSGDGTVPTAPPNTGIYGYAAQGAGARGVHGRSTSGRGVFGQATSGAGLYGAATSGHALRTSGRILLEKASGVATILAGNTVVKVTPGIDVTSMSFVLLTPKGDLVTRRLWYSTDTTANTFTIRVSSAVTANLRVGWLLLG